ncbi:AT-rich interactive domain-containing protein 4B [Pholidichthys leucotaenia]
MKTLEEPPYLTVGTDVSAKYRGAFCEAKIKTAKRLVKAKVTFKPDLSSAEVHDENIKGPLKVGAVVEVKNQDGVYQEATINKLTDASIYTVVFDDGDEKTLRRSSLCLKGARHFAESETLDRLPLTNPEHFGTPVIGKKGNRGRRSNPIQEEELSSSSSEDEESDQPQNEDLFGKVVCVEGVATGDKKKTAWYPALVISPDCHEDVTVKKDNIFVRSFKDGKFYTVLRKDVREMNSDCPPKADVGLKPALDAALEFQQHLVVPTAWKTEVKEESSSSEEDDDDEEEEQEEDASGEEEEEEVEPFPEERENFLQQLYKFMEDRGTPINKRPVLGYRNLNLFKLYRLVHKLGGFDNIEGGSVWKQVYQDLGIPVLNSAAGYNVKCAYRKYLYGFEEYCTSTAITFKMDLPLKQSHKGEVKSVQEEARVKAPTLSNSEEQKSKVDGEPSSVQSTVCKDEKPDLTQSKAELEPSKTEEKEGQNNDDEADSPHKVDADEGSSTARVGAEGVKQERDKQQESKDNSGDDSSQEGEEGEEFECYPPGMKVQVRYGRGRNLKTYEATVKEADVEGGEVLYLVHYCGWNVRYDEWIKADKIVRPANKNVPKIKHRKKIKNKAEREQNRLERLNDREVVGPSPNTNRGPRSKCGLSQDVFSKMDEGEDKGTQQSPVKSIEITSILNGLQASEMSTDESEHDDEVGLHNEEERPGGQGSLRKGPPELPQIPERWESGAPSEDSKPSQSVNVENTDGGKRRSQPESEGEAGTRKRKAEGAVERTPKGQPRAKTRNTRSADWLPGGSPRKLEERVVGLAEERGASFSSSSDDEGTALADSQIGENDRRRPKTKASPSKKYNGMKDKTKTGRQGGFWEIAEKKAKSSVNVEERVRPKGQKDVWSSIQGQWPKKTLKELFSDSDTEAANSPPPAVPSCLEEPDVEQDAEPENEASEEQPENDKLQEFPSSGSNSVLNTPPTTPESPSGGGSAVEDSVQAQPPSPPPSLPPALPSEQVSNALPPGPIVEEGPGGRSETDSSTVEVESLGGELQELPQDEGAGSPSKVFDVSLSCNSSSSCSLELSNSSQQESEHKSKASVSQKRQKESQTCGASKKHKPNRKSLGVPPKKNRKTANSSDSEDQSVVEAKSAASKSNSSDMKAATSPKCHGRSPTSSHKYHKQGDTDHAQHRDHHGKSPRVYKWSFQMSDLEKMSSLERISFLQEKLQDIRNHYLSLKSEVASIDRRRKRMKKKERESTVAASSSSSSSSSPSSSSLTAAVMLTLADPPVSSSSSSSSQNSGVSVECR